MEDSETPIPPFFLPVLKKIKKTINSAGKAQGSEVEENEET